MKRSLLRLLGYIVAQRAQIFLRLGDQVHSISNFILRSQLNEYN
jgi:hypothetical protein